ncbi:hypothetical protein ACTUSZ_03965 [Pantoea eucalypti]|uniref:hypothetical protein n=1 Tax=Pantoea TaxID=53335 RepID=UPI001C745F9F|nr:hypothetical protein KTJ90_19750 [Pantoea jilinensis]
MKRLTPALTFISMMITSLTVIGAEKSTDKVGASGKCLGYLSMFNEEDLKAKSTLTQDLLDLYRSSLSEAMQTSSINGEQVIPADIYTLSIDASAFVS